MTPRPFPLRPLLFSTLGLLIWGWPGLAQERPAPKAPGPPPPRLLAAPERRGLLPEERIPESSSLVRSAHDQDLFWTFNDSGGEAVLFAISRKGKLKGELRLRDIQNKDWEAMAADRQGRLIVGDVGNNQQSRRKFELYRFVEPERKGEKSLVSEVETFRFRYPEGAGPVDCEALVVWGEAAYLFSKEDRRTRVFRVGLAAAQAQALQEAELTAESDTFALCTDAALSKDGSTLVLLSYTRLAIFTLPAPAQGLPGGAAQKLPALVTSAALRAPDRHLLLFVGQAEGVAWDGQRLLLSTEKMPGFPASLWEIQDAR